MKSALKHTTITTLFMACLMMAVLGVRIYRHAQRAGSEPSSVTIATHLPDQPRFAFHQIQGGQSMKIEPAHWLNIEPDANHARLITQTLDSLSIQALNKLASDHKNVGDITLKHHQDNEQQRYLFPAFEIYAWPGQSDVTPSTPPAFKLTVVNNHWAILQVAGNEIIRGRLSETITEALAPLHNPALMHYNEPEGSK